MRSACASIYIKSGRASSFAPLQAKGHERMARPAEDEAAQGEAVGDGAAEAVEVLCWPVQAGQAVAVEGGRDRAGERTAEGRALSAADEEARRRGEDGDGGGAAVIGADGHRRGARALGRLEHVADEHVEEGACGASLVALDAGRKRIATKVFITCLVHIACITCLVPIATAVNGKACKKERCRPFAAIFTNEALQDDQVCTGRAPAPPGSIKDDGSCVAP